MKVTLVYAGITGHGFATAGKGMDAGWISHGLCLLGACAKEAGHQVDLVDLRALTSWEHFRAELGARRPEVVGVTMMSVDYNPAMRCFDIIKQTLPQAVTVVGGAHPTLALDEVAPNPNIDYIITHEGEIAFVDLLAGLSRGEAASRVIEGSKPELEKLPFADRDLFLAEWRKAGYRLDSPEVPMGDLPAPFVTIIAGRGCTYNCSFCQPAERTLFGGRVRRRSVQNVIAELEHLRRRYGFRSLLIHDDCLTEDRQWVTEFCSAYKQSGFNQPFYCQTRADIVVKNPDMVGLMRSVGLSGFLIGFESGSDRVLRFIRKGTTAAQNLEAARLCHRLGIKIWANYMLGLPTETPAEVLQTVNMLREIDPDYYSPAFYTPHPGSELYSYCQEHDLSLIKDHDSYRRNPDEAKIKGHDYEFLAQAVRQSQKRRLSNSARRWLRSNLRRYASPRRIASRLKRLVESQAPS